MYSNSDLKGNLLKTVEFQNGLLFTVPALVHRQMYSGQNIIAKNLKFEKEYTDERGYLPVELWLLSMIEAKNEFSKENEGLTVIKLFQSESDKGPGTITLKDAAKLAEKELFGEHMKNWPLTKILDIGGEPVATTFSNEKEISPIPPHIHGGEIVDGKAVKPGKIEAYFFPPVTVSPYNKQSDQKVISRIGFKPTTTLDNFKENLSNFGFDDSMYTLLQEYEVKPFTGWTIPDGLIHSPGPSITFEIQLPQDDYNFAGWRFGCHCHSKEEQQKMFENFVLRGLKDKDDFCQQILNWNLSSDPDLSKKFKTDIKIIKEGDWGRLYQIFFHYFYGEGWEIKPNQKVILGCKDRPIGGLVWSGKGFINKNRVQNNSEGKHNYEFFIVPQTVVKIRNDDPNETLIIFTVEPFQLKY